jgi:hypothetical protein
MNLQARKLELIEYLIQVNDEKVINQIENLIDKSNLTPFTKNELISRAKQSELDFQAGKFKTQEQLETDSIHW